MKKGKKKGKLSTIILILVFLAGLSLLLYPTVSSYVNSLHQSRAVVNYNKEVSHMDQGRYDEIWKSAVYYNQSLAEQPQKFFLNEEQMENYQSQLNISGNGIMGHVEIPKINCSLPIYHGTEEAVLQVAIGHVDWTSLPVGGESSHCVLSGHRGLPSARLFTDLDEMKAGDTFFLKVMNEVLTYEVDQILVVLPHETDALEIAEGKDYCTLVTCTPYGKNTHRLLVRGHRTKTVIEQKENVVTKAVEEVTGIEFRLVIPMIISGVLLLILIILLLSGRGSKKKKKNHGGGVNEDK